MESGGVAVGQDLIGGVPKINGRPVSQDVLRANKTGSESPYAKTIEYRNLT
jgi:hypothetical protein